MPAPRSLSHKLDTVKRVSALIAQGTPMRSACRSLNVPVNSFKKWRARLHEGGESALNTRYANCGRKPKWQLNADEQKAVRSLVLMRDSQAFAIEEFARQHQDCRPETREAILAELDQANREHRYPRWPVSLRRAAAITSEDRALFRGRKHFEALSFSPRKGLFFTDEDGRKVPLYPHTAWVMDDYSTNQPYIVDTEAGAERVCRQTLAAMDCASDAWLSVEMIGRERDAYRAEDILRFILRTIDGQGTMPLYLLLERGRWDSIAVHGLDLEKELGPKFKGRFWGALDHLFGIIHGYSSRHKAQLESSFSLLQRALAHSGTEIGRHRSEFENATKSMLAVQAGRRDPHRAGFLTIDEAREAHWNAMQYLNGRGKHRAATGTVEVPDDLLAMWDPAADARPLPESERWRFLPVKRLCTVRGGFVEMTVAPYKQPFRFQINGTASGLYLPAGYRLLVAFDPATPATGAHVCNGEHTVLNRDALPIGEFITTAPHAEDVGMFSLRVGGLPEGEKDKSKKRASTAARTAFASINPLRRGLAVDAQLVGDGDATISRRGVKRAQDGLTGSNRSVSDEITVAHRTTAEHGTRHTSTRPARSATEIAAIERDAEESLLVL